MEKYSLEKAKEEAEILRKKVESGKAWNYIEAEKQLERYGSRSLYSEEEAKMEAELLKVLVESGQTEDYSGAEKLLFEQYTHLLESKENGVQIEVKDISEQIERELGDWIDDYMKIIEELGILYEEEISKLGDNFYFPRLNSNEKIDLKNKELEQILTKERILKLHNFVDNISEGRYLRFDTLNHQMWGDYDRGSRPKINISEKDKIDYLLFESSINFYVSNFYNSYLRPEYPLLILGSKNPRFTSYIKELLDIYITDRVKKINSKLPSGSIENSNDDKSLRSTPEKEIKNLEEIIKKDSKPIIKFIDRKYEMISNTPAVYTENNPFYKKFFSKLMRNGVKEICDPAKYNDLYPSSGGRSPDSFWPEVCLAILQKKDFFISNGVIGMVLPNKNNLVGKKDPHIAISDVVECVVDIRNKKVILIR